MVSIPVRKSVAPKLEHDRTDTPRFPLFSTEQRGEEASQQIFDAPFQRHSVCRLLQAPDNLSLERDAKAKMLPRRPGRLMRVGLAEDPDGGHEQTRAEGGGRVNRKLDGRTLRLQALHA